MSYSLLGHFVDAKNKKFICTADISFLKDLNIRSYSNQFDKIYPTGKANKNDYEETKKYTYAEFVNYVREDILEDSQIKNLIVKYSSENYPSDFRKYIIFEESAKEKQSLINNYIVSNIDFSDSSKKSSIVMLFYRKNKEIDGLWYTLKDFNDALNEYTKEYEDNQNRLAKLKSMEDTIEWFKLDDDCRERILTEIKYAEESKEDSRCKLESLQKIINVMDFMKYDVGYLKNELDTEWDWNYSEDRDIEVFIEVC